MIPPDLGFDIGGWRPRGRGVPGPLDVETWTTAWIDVTELVRWAGSLDDELLLLLIVELEAIVQYRNALDRASAWRGPWNPWRALRKQWHKITLGFTDWGDDGVMGMTTPPCSVERCAIVLNDAYFGRRDRWETLTHELNHIRRGLAWVDEALPYSDDRRPGEDPVREKEERAVKRATRVLMSRSEFELFRRRAPL